MLQCNFIEDGTYFYREICYYEHFLHMSINCVKKNCYFLEMPRVRMENH